jgi:hypothetical protein
MSATVANENKRIISVVFDLTVEGYVNWFYLTDRAVFCAAGPCCRGALMLN